MVDVIENNKDNKDVILDLVIRDRNIFFDASISSEIENTENELRELEIQLAEKNEVIKNLTPNCDKTDYILAACSGALCGVLDIFFTGKPGESSFSNITDEWFADRTKDFAKLYAGWDDSKNSSLSSAIRKLENKFQIPYDQRGMGDAASFVFDLNVKNHHFKSLGHNPTLLGLFFSILDQFTNTSHFVSGEELISLQDADNSFYLEGNDTPSKIFCGYINWLGHLISDMSGSHSSKGRGMGIPSPFWAWINDVIVIKRKLGLESSQFDKSFYELALEIYKEGYDLRFQAAQAIPVFINEMLVRFIYSLRRLIIYCSKQEESERTLSGLWQYCKPSSNATVKRMLTVAHGTFCLLDLGDATISGFVYGTGMFNVKEFFLRLNIIGVGRFTVSLYGEGVRCIDLQKTEKDRDYLQKEKKLINDYVEGLKILAEVYDDQMLVTFTEEIMNSDLYIEAFSKSVMLAEKRNVPEDKILRNKSDIDRFFQGGNS